MAQCELDYDTIVVGAGPSGLTLATYLPGRTLVLERDATIGGIHKVRRDVEGYFSEHGPRVYSGTFYNFKRVLQDIGLPWDQVFAPAQFSPQLIDGKNWYRWLSVREVSVLVLHFMLMAINPSHGKNVTMQDMCRAYGFSDRSCRYIDAVCRFSDGAGADRYSLHEFLHGFSDHGKGFFEPRKANDKLLFPHWQRFLEGRGVQIKLATPVAKVEHRCGRVTGVSVTVGKEVKSYTAPRVVMAIPPENAAALLRASGLKEPGYATFSRATRYEEYFCVTYHFPSDAAPLVTHAGLRSTPWGLVYMEMSKYMSGEATAFISVAASQLRVRSPRTGKTVHESTRPEAIAEILRQLPIADDLKARLVKAVPSSCLQRTKDMWVNIDKAYIYSARYPGGWPATLGCCRGLHNVGCQNGLSWYPFTSFESAVGNALIFLGQREIVPWTVLTVLRLLPVLLLLAWAARFAWRRRRLLRCRARR